MYSLTVGLISMRAVLFLLGLLLVLPARAEWTKVFTYMAGSIDERTEFVDLETLRKTDNGRRIWVLLNLSSGSMKALTELDCDGDRVRHLAASTFSNQMGVGLPTYSLPKASNWDYVQPNSTGDNLSKFVCQLPLPK
jgi:hypothetical protein